MAAHTADEAAVDALAGAVQSVRPRLTTVRTSQLNTQPPRPFRPVAQRAAATPTRTAAAERASVGGGAAVPAWCPTDDDVARVQRAESMRKNRAAQLVHLFSLVSLPTK